MTSIILIIKRINDFNKGISDYEVFQIALQEKRTILTIDRDFFAYKKKENYGIISISGKLLNPIEKMYIVLQRIKKDETLPNDFMNMFIRITNQNFAITYKKKNKYKKVKREYKKGN